MSQPSTASLIREVYSGTTDKLASEGRWDLAKVATHLACVADGVPSGTPIPPTTLEKTAKVHALLVGADRDGRARAQAEIAEQEKLARAGDAKAIQYMVNFLG